MRTTQDPAERQRLMAEHMRLMHEGMAMMGPMMRGGPSDQAGQPPCADNDTQCRMQRMQMQQGMMGQRLGMMQMMMQQMMMQMMQNQAAQGQQDKPAANAPANPQTKEEVQALIDSLDMKLASGEISEDIYKKLVAKWEQRLKELGG